MLTRLAFLIHLIIYKNNLIQWHPLVHNEPPEHNLTLILLGDRVSRLVRTNILSLSSLIHTLIIHLHILALIITLNWDNRS